MSKIFLSYRRGDEAGYVARLADGLEGAFGSVVFRDVDSILPGSEWKLELRKEISEAQVLIAVIGQRWQSILAEQKKEEDQLRFELNLAHELGIPVIPVRLKDASLNFEQELGDLSWLRDLQFFELTDRQRRWAIELDQLVERIVALTALERIKQSDQQSSGSQTHFIQFASGGLRFFQQDILDYYRTFVGREQDIDDIREYLTGSGGGYYLVQGKAGIGKTALVARLFQLSEDDHFGENLARVVFFKRTPNPDDCRAPDLNQPRSVWSGMRNQRTVRGIDQNRFVGREQFVNNFLPNTR